MAATVPPQQVTASQKLAQVNEQTWLTMGNLAEMMTDYDKAMNCYEAALRHNPYSIVALSQIASLCRGREQFGKAVDYFKRILAIQDNNGETWAALGHCYLMMDNLQDAYQAYQQALYHLSNPKDPKLWYGIGILYDRYGSLEHAEEAFSAVMKMDPKFEKANEIYFRLGIIYKQQQKYEQSLQCFRFILFNPPRPLTESDIWFQTGHVHEQQKEYELAKEAYERVLAENPDHAKVLQQLGWLYHQQNTSFCNQALAIQYLTRSLKSDSADAQSWYLLGRCYMAEQNYNKAYEAYQQAVYRDARNPTFWCSIGVLYYQINQYRDALDAYSRAIRLNPYISEVWYDLGTLYESCNNQVQDALDAYQRAAELDHTNPHIKQRLELLRKSQNVQSSQVTNSAPIPQDVSNPSQYQTGHNGQPLNGVSYSQSAPTGPPISMSAYHTAIGASGNPQRGNDERVSTPQLPIVNHPMTSHENNNGPTRDLPMPGPSPAGSGRRSPVGYPQYLSHPSNPNASREDVRIPDIGGGRAPTPSDRSQMNPIIHDERQNPIPSQSQPPQHSQLVQPPQQSQPPQHSSQSNLPPMSMRPSYKQDETRSPNPVQAQPSSLLSSPHPRSSPRSSHPLAPHQFDRHSPRTGHSDGYRFEQRSPAQRNVDSEGSSQKSRPEIYNGRPPIMKHEEPSIYHNVPRPLSAMDERNINKPMPNPMPMKDEQEKKESYHPQAPLQSPQQPLPSQMQMEQQHSATPPTQPSHKSVPESMAMSRPSVDEDYDESAADVLLSMGNPQLGQKRALLHEHENHKKSRHNDDSYTAPSNLNDREMESEIKEDRQEMVKEEEMKADEMNMDKEDGENDDEMEEGERKDETPIEMVDKHKEEHEEGEVVEKEEGEVKDEDEKSVASVVTPSSTHMNIESKDDSRTESV